MPLTPRDAECDEVSAGGVLDHLAQPSGSLQVARGPWGATLYLSATAPQ